MHISPDELFYGFLLLSVVGQLLFGTPAAMFKEDEEQS